MSTFSENNLIKKLEHVSSTQDSIQTLSLWVLHHKSHYKQIVEQWLKCYLKAKSSHQLSLFYLANDIIQHAKRKSVVSYLNEFKGTLREAAKVTNDAKIVPNINRVFNIWADRNIYSKEFIEELRGLLCGEDVKLELISKIVSDYSSNDVISQINNIGKVEQQTKSKQQSLGNCKIDFSNNELLNKLKDKSGGDQFNQEFDEATKCLGHVIEALEKEVALRKELLLKLDKTKIFYDIQLKEAKTVADAFNNCEIRVKQVKSKLEGFSSCPKKTTSTIADSINTSTLMSVINSIKQAQDANSTSSLDQRLTSLMSNSSQFGLSLKEENEQSFQPMYDPGYQPAYNPSNSLDSSLYDKYYLPTEHNVGNTSLESVSGVSRGREAALENTEPADMDLGNSDDDDKGDVKNAILLNKNNNIDDKQKQRPINMPLTFNAAQNILGMLSGTPLNPMPLMHLPPPPPPPPPPPLPPALKDFEGLFNDDPFDPFYGGPNMLPIPGMVVVDPNQQQGSTIRNLADRPHRNSMPYPLQAPNANNWINNPSDNRQPRGQNFNSNNFNSNPNNANQGNRWKSNNNSNNTNNRGTWKRNSYGNHH